jgi:hypothetical protein
MRRSEERSPPKQLLSDSGALTEGGRLSAALFFQPDNFN